MGARPRPRVVVMWHSPVEAFSMECHPFRPLWLAVVLAVWRWLGWCLPSCRFDDGNDRYQFLALYVAVIRGPYACALCGGATSFGGDALVGIPPYCGRRRCCAQIASRAGA